MVRSLPSFYKAEVNTMIRGLLQAWSLGDDEVEVQIRETKDQLFVEQADGPFLDLLGNNVGVPRASELGIDDDDFRKLIPVMSFFPKQVRKTIVALLDVFWGPGFTRPNINSGNIETFDFGPEINLTGTITFRDGAKTLIGIGTLFTTELQPGDYIRAVLADGTTYVKVSSIVDDFTLELSTEWNGGFALNSGVVKGVIRELTYIVDGGEERRLRIRPNAFSDLTAITVQELVNSINKDVEHNDYLTASVFLDPLAGNKLNLRTNTAGLQGSIQITGGDANDPTRLDFDLAEQRETKANVYEVNPNEIVVRIPSSVPVLRRRLQGSLHTKDTKTIILSEYEVFDFSGLGASSTLEVDIDGSPFTVTFTHASDFADSTQVTAEEVALVINDQLTFLEAFAEDANSRKPVGLRTTEGSAEYQVTGGTANAVLNFDTTLQTDPDLIVTDYPSAYLFDPTGQLFTVTGKSSELSQKVETGTITSTLSLIDASNFQNQPGNFLLNFGRGNQEGPIKYNSRPNNSTLLIDASYGFQNEHLIGSKINFISNSPTIPRVTGDDYPVFVVGTEAARAAAEDLIRKLLAAGVVVRFLIDFPEFLFECTCRGCLPENDPDLKGSLTDGDPLTF